MVQVLAPRRALGLKENSWDVHRTMCTLTATEFHLVVEKEKRILLEKKHGPSKAPDGLELIPLLKIF